MSFYNNTKRKAQGDFASRLAKILGRLGSDSDHEVIVAARTAEKMVRGANTTWDAVIVNPSSTRTTRQAEACRAPTLQQTVERCLRHSSRLTDFERDFLGSIAMRRAPLTEKQQNILNQILEKVEAFERGR